MKFNHSFKTLQNSLEKYKNYEFKYLVIDNSINYEYFSEKEKNVFVINGDNSEREFSGWTRGLIKVRELELNYQVALFINEAYIAYNDSYIDKYFNIAVKRCLRHNAAVGLFDKNETGRELISKDLTFKKWLRSNIVLLPNQILTKLDSFIFISNSEFEEIIPAEFPQNVNTYNDYFSDSIMINDEFKFKIFNWLTNQWHSRFDLNPQNWGLFRMKAKAIINEALFGQTINFMGFKTLWYAPRFIVYFNKLIRKISIRIRN